MHVLRIQIFYLDVRWEAIVKVDRNRRHKKTGASGRFFCIQGALSGTLRSLCGARGRLVRSIKTGACGAIVQLGIQIGIHGR